MKADFNYDVVYYKNVDPDSKHIQVKGINVLSCENEDPSRKYIHVKGIDLFSAQYYAIMLNEREDVISVLIERYKCDENGREFDCVVVPGKADRDSAMHALLGGNLLNNKYESLIHDELSAKVLAAGIELGIMRAAMIIQLAACNRDDDVLSSELDDVAQDILIHAPCHHVQWKTIGALHAENQRLQKQIDDNKKKGLEAKEEYHKRLGAKPSFGIMDLPKVREFLENL